MYIKLSLTILVALSVAVHGSGYFPSIGGPWGSYTTTTPTPGSGEGFNLPATEAPPPPSVTFVPGPRPVPQRPISDNNRVDGQNQNGNFMPQNFDFYIVTDPMTGEQFTVPRQNFWNRVGNGGNIQPTRGQSEQGQGQNQNSRNPQPQQDRSDEGFNRNAEEDFIVPQTRAKRSTNNPEESTSDALKVNQDGSEEPRHIDMLADDSAEEKSLDDKVLSVPRENQEDNNESEEMPRRSMQNLNVIDSQEYQGPGIPFKTTADLFKIFFPDLKMDQGKKMLYTYSQYRHYPTEKPTTTATPTTMRTTTTPTTTTTTTTPIPTTETAAPVEHEKPESTTIAAKEESTTVVPHENASPNLS